MCMDFCVFERLAISFYRSPDSSRFVVHNINYYYTACYEYEGIADNIFSFVRCVLYLFVCYISIYMYVCTAISICGETSQKWVVEMLTTFSQR